MNKLELVIPGEPCAQGRPRFSTVGGFVKAYDPEKSRNYKAFVKCVVMDSIKKTGWTLTDLPLCVEITAFMGIPSSKPKKFKERALAGLERPNKKPDVDNMFKIITDALSGIVYKDDKQIVSAKVSKYYTDIPYVAVKIVAVGGEKK